MSGFPKMMNSGKAKIADKQVTFSYLDSKSEAKTVTKPLLSPDRIVTMVRGRDERFDKAGPGARESDRSRTERKYISAQPKATLILARRKMDDHLKMEFDMMLDQNSHHGISDPKWIEVYAGNFPEVIGDDGKPL